MTNATQYGVYCITDFTFEMTAIKQAFIFHMPDHRLDYAASA